jgi:hydrogenase maturation protease
VSAPAGPLLVIGIGNVLLGDEGVGVHVLRELERRAGRGDVSLPADTRLIEGGTMGLSLLPLLAGARAVLFLDAVDLRLAPGAVVVLRCEALRGQVGGRGHVQLAGVAELLCAARLAGLLPAAVALVGVQPGEIEIGLDLTEVVRAALPAAVAATIDELRQLEAAAAAPAASGQRPMDVQHELTGSAA